MSDQTPIVQIAGQAVVIAYDAEAEVWSVHTSSVPGLTGETARAPDLIEEPQVTVRTLSLS